MLPVLCPRASGNMIFICLSSNSPEPNVKMQKEVGPFFYPLMNCCDILCHQIPVGDTHIFGTILEKATVDFSRTNAKTIFFFFFFLITGGWTKGIWFLD